MPNGRQSGPNQVYRFVRESRSTVTAGDVSVFGAVAKEERGPRWGRARDYLLLLIILYNLINYYTKIIAN